MFDISKDLISKISNAIKGQKLELQYANGISYFCVLCGGGVASGCRNTCNNNCVGGCEDHCSNTCDCSCTENCDRGCCGNN